MPPFGFDRKGQPQSFTTDIADEEDLEEIKAIADAAGIGTQSL